MGRGEVREGGTQEGERKKRQKGGSVPPPVVVPTCRPLRGRWVWPGLIVWQSSHQPNWTRQNFSPTNLNKGINSYLFTEGALDFSPTKRNLLLANSWNFSPTSFWEVPYYLIWGSGRTAEEVRDRVTGVRAFRALWSRLSSYAVPVVSHGWGETRAELGEGHAVCPGEAPLRGRDRRRADSQQPVWGEGGYGGGNSVRVHLPEGLAVGVGLHDAIDEVGGDQRSEAGLQGVPDVARAWVRGDGRVGGMVRSEGTEEELGAEHGQMGANRSTEASWWRWSVEAILREPVAMRRAEFWMDCKVETAVVGALGNQTGAA